MRDDHAYVMQVKLWKANTRGVTFWTHPMELLRDMGLVESHFSPFGDNVSVIAR